jgi:hypothetical protein
MKKEIENTEFIPKKGEKFHAYTRQYNNRHYQSPFVCVKPLVKRSVPARKPNPKKATIAKNEMCDKWTLWHEFFYFLPA